MGKGGVAASASERELGDAQLDLPGGEVGVHVLGPAPGDRPERRR